MLYHYQQALNNRQDACSTIHKFCCVFDTKQALNNRQDACSTIHKFCCIFDTKQALNNRQDACSTIYKFYFLWCGHLARTYKEIYMRWVTY